MRQRARVHGGVLRCAEARVRAGQRELPLRRRRARVPARQLRRRSRSCSTTSSPRPSPTRSPTLPAERRPRVLLQVAHAGDGTLLAGARDYERRVAAAPATSRPTREPSATISCSSTPAAPPATPRPSCGAATTSTCRCGRWRGPAPSRPTSAAAIAAGKQAATLLPACPLMHGTGLFIALSTLVGRRHGRAARHAAPRRRRGVGRGRARTRAGVHDRRRRVRAAAARRARRRARTLGPCEPARDHVVGRHVEPRDQARAARPPARRHADRLARRVGRHHDAHRDPRRRRHRARAVQGQRPAGGRHRRR